MPSPAQPKILSQVVEITALANLAIERMESERRDSDELVKFALQGIADVGQHVALRLARKAKPWPALLGRGRIV